MERRGRRNWKKKSANVFTPYCTPWTSPMSDREMFFEPGEYEFACFVGGLWGYLGIRILESGASAKSKLCSGVLWLFWEMIPSEGYYFMRYAIAHL